MVDDYNYSITAETEAAETANDEARKWLFNDVNSSFKFQQRAVDVILVIYGLMYPSLFGKLLLLAKVIDLVLATYYTNIALKKIADNTYDDEYVNKTKRNTYISNIICYILFILALFL